jgi:cytosine/uracil/thiamine/allantoin permease
VPGFLGAIGVSVVSSSWMDLYHYAWFLSFGVSFAAYAVLMKRRPASA